MNSDYKPRLKDSDFVTKGAKPLNETELDDVSVKCWEALRTQVLSLGVGGEGMSASLVQGYVWGFVDSYLQQFKPPCTADSFYDVLSQINFYQLSQINLHELTEEQLSNQIAEPNSDFLTAVMIGGADGNAWSVDQTYEPDGLQALFDEEDSQHMDTDTTTSASYELGQKVGEAIRATKSLSIFEKIKLDSPASRLSDDELFEKAYDELQNNELIKGVWARALSNSDGNEKKAEALYLKLRVQQIKDEMHENKKRQNENQKNLEKTRQKKEQQKRNKEERIQAQVRYLEKVEKEKLRAEQERIALQEYYSKPAKPFPKSNILIFLIAVVVFFAVTNAIIY